MSGRGEQMTETKGEMSPRLQARIAGAFYLVSVVTAVFSEFIFRGRLGFFAAVVVPVSCYIAVVLLLYGIFRAVNKRLSWVFVFFGLAGLVCEALHLQTRGMNLGMVFHGFYCVVLGFLMLRSTFLPRILGVLMAFAGLVWLLYLLPPLALHLAPYNTAVGLAGEALPMLWLLAMGVNAEQWHEQAAAIGKRPNRGAAAGGA
jgi:glucan phosphoethanolaminetransferase (alkaline phosphatase superfamily)